MHYRCRACGGGALYEVLDLGNMPLAGDFRAAGESNRLYPLAIDGCESCGVLQIRETVDQAILFNPKYCYSSSTVRGLVRHFENYAREVALAPGTIKPKHLLDIGCNDGIFLEPLSRVGYEVVGIDASENVALMARNKGFDVHVGFFNLETARRLNRQYGYFDIITCSNVFAHNFLLDEFIQAVDFLLDPKDGQFWVEVHSAYRLYEGLQWDCFYHEHCFYWTIQALQACLKKYGYNVKHYQTTNMHGGAIRAVFAKSNNSLEVMDKQLTPYDWRRFAKQCLRSRKLIQETLEKLPICYAYGAAGRAVTLINWAGIEKKIDFVVDGSPLRFNKLIPNTNIPIISEDIFFKRPELNDWCFITAHNYFDEIRAKVQDGFPNKEIKFVTPLPYVAIR